MNLWSSLWHIPAYIRVHHQLVLTVFAAVKAVQAAHIQTGVHVHCMCTVPPSCVIEHMHACTCIYARWNAVQSTLLGCWECFIVWNQAIPSLEASLGCTLWAAVYGTSGDTYSACNITGTNWAYPVHSCTCIWSSLIYTHIPFLVSFSLVISCPRLQWWGRERGGDDGGGRGQRGIREEGGGNICW